MAFLMLYPAIAVLTMFVLMVIILILRFGSRWCKLRHTTPLHTHQYFTDQEYWNEDLAYDQKVSDA